jgi:hypothetical protein
VISPGPKGCVVFVVVALMSGTIDWVLAGAVCWAGVVCVTLAVLTEAQHADAAGTGRAVRPPVAVLATSERLFWFVLDVQGVLGVERVAVVMHERTASGVGVIVACCGCPELVGSRIRVDGGFGWGPGAESRFLVEPPERWSVVSVPIAGPAGIAGTVAVATRRERGISELEVGLLERMTVRAAVDDAVATGARSHIPHVA